DARPTLRTRARPDDRRGTATFNRADTRMDGVHAQAKSVLGPGDGCLMNNAEVGAMTLPAETPPFITFRVPAAAVAPLVPDLRAVVAQRVLADSPALRLLVRYLEILQDTSALATPQLQHVVATHVYDLLALAVGATHEAAEIANGRGLRAARLQAVLAEIKAH